MSLLLHGMFAYYWPTANLSAASNPPSTPGNEIRMHIERAQPVVRQPIQEATNEPPVASPKPKPESEIVSRLEPEPARVEPEPQPVIEKQPRQLVKLQPEPLLRPGTAAIESSPKLSNRRLSKPRSRPERRPQERPTPDAPTPQPTVATVTRPVLTTPAEAGRSPTVAAAPAPTDEPMVDTQRQQAIRLMIIDWLQAELKQHFSYPFQARRRGWQGTVILEFTVATRGGITDIRIAESSGHQMLDRNAEKTLQHIARSGMASLPYVGQTMSLAVPVSYRLR
jgi:protein TonB